MGNGAKGAVLVAVVALATGCSSAGSGSPATASITSQAVATTPASQPATAAAWTAARLKPALLVVKDLPTGYQADPSGESNDTGGLSSKDAGCTSLVKIMNANQPTGTLAFAKTGFTGGSNGPLVNEEVDGMASAQAAQASLDQLARAAKTCTTVQMPVSAGSLSAGHLTVIPAPHLGDKATAFRVSITSGTAAGLSIAIVGVATGRVIVGMTFALAKSTDVDSMTTLAVDKAKAALPE